MAWHILTILKMLDQFPTLFLKKRTYLKFKPGTTNQGENKMKISSGSIISVNGMAVKLSAVRKGQKTFKGIELASDREFKFLACHIKPVDRGSVMDLVTDKAVKDETGMVKDACYQPTGIQVAMNFLGI